MTGPTHDDAGQGEHPWIGSWVSQHLGITVRQTPGSPQGLSFTDLAGLAIRRNTRRAHLVVSTVLGKHIPVHPHRAVTAGRRLGVLAAAKIPQGQPVTVVGYAETATSLGHLVSDVFDEVWYLHSTRRRNPWIAPLDSFQEDHSHATEHLLIPHDPRSLVNNHPTVIVDDELTTGKTAATTIRTLQSLCPRKHYVIAALVDLRDSHDRCMLDQVSRDLGITIDVVSLVAVELDIPDNVIARGMKLVEDFETPDDVDDSTLAPVRRLVAPWPEGLPHGGCHGFDHTHRKLFTTATETVAQAIDKDLSAAGVSDDSRILILGTEELMYAPMMIARQLVRWRNGPVLFSSTTRSPVLPLDVKGYAVKTRVSYVSHEPIHPDQVTERFAYNIAPATGETSFDHVVVIVDDVAHTPALWGEKGLVQRLRGVCGGVSVVVLPEEPWHRATPSSPTIVGRKTSEEARR